MDSNDRKPPQAITSEKIILASYLTYPDIIDDFIEITTSDMFYSPANEAVMRAIETLYAHSKVIDMLSVNEELKTAKTILSKGGEAYLSEIVSEVALNRNLTTHIALVKSNYVLRQIIKAADSAQQRAYEQGVNANDLLLEVDAAFLKIYDKGEKSAPQHVSELIVPSLDRIAEAVKGEGIPKISFGFKKLDEKTGGLHGGELIIVAARPRMGKTSLMLNMSVGCKVPNAVFSVEMPKIQVIQRYQSIYSRLPLFKLRNGQLTKEEFEEVSRVSALIAKLPIYVDDSFDLNIISFRSKLRRLIKKYDIEVAFVDYLQLMRGVRRNQDKREQVSEISNGLKGVAKEFDIPVVALAQLSRGLESRGINDRRPRLPDIKESGDIEQDADGIIFVHRQHQYSGKEEEKDLAELIIGKQRNGPADIICPVAWNGELTLFHDFYDDREAEQGEIF